MRREKSAPLVGVQRAKPRMLMDHSAQRETVGRTEHEAKRRARRFDALPRSGELDAARMQQIRRRAPLRAVREHLPDVRREERWHAFFLPQTRRTRVRNLVGDDGGKPLIHEREMLEDAGNRPAIRSGRLIAQMRWNAVDRCAQAGTRPIEGGKYLSKR